MLSRTVALLLAVVLLAAGCDGPGAGSDDPPGRAKASARVPAPPTPAERLQLLPGWGPTRAELDRAARLALRMPLRQLAGQVIVASYAGTAAPTRMVSRLHL